MDTAALVLARNEVAWRKVQAAVVAVHLSHDFLNEAPVIGLTKCY